MKKLSIYILIIILLFNSSSNAFGASKRGISKHSKSHKTVVAKSKSKLALNSEAAILMDLDTGALLYSKNIHERLYPASTTKILTAILTLESGSLDRIVTVGKNPPTVEPSKIDLKQGEKIQLRYLLYALLVDSANDAAVAIAEYIGGSEENFAKMMNAKAKLIGCRDSHFANPNGLPNRNHYTSAYDLAIITRYAMKNLTFRKVVATKSYIIPPTNMSQARSITNHNKMILPSSSYYYPGCIGVKTGYTIVSRHTLVSAAVRGNKRLLSVILKDSTPPYNDIEALFNYGFKK